MPAQGRRNCATNGIKAICGALATTDSGKPMANYGKILTMIAAPTLHRVTMPVDPFHKLPIYFRA